MNKQQSQIKNPAYKGSADTKKEPTQPDYEDKPGQSTQASGKIDQATDKSCGCAIPEDAPSNQEQGETFGAKESTMTAVKTNTNVQTITKDQLLQKIKSNSGVQVVNVLSSEYYNLGFIKGSLKIPLADLDKRFNELNKDKEVVTYCASSTCSASMKAAELLAAKGFNVKAYEGGIKEWSGAGLPTEK